MSWPPDKFPFVYGPWDGAVLPGVEGMPQTIYVPKLVPHTRLVGFQREPNRDFCVCYVMDAAKFVYSPKDSV